MSSGIFQEFTLHVRTNQRVIPCIYALLPSKNQNTYDGFFQEIFIRVAAIGNPPTSMLFDFEVAAINSFSEILPNTSVSGCFYHLPANIWARIQEVGLQERYNNDPKFALHLRMIAALAFFPPGNIVNVFERCIHWKGPQKCCAWLTVILHRIVAYAPPYQLGEAKNQQSYRGSHLRFQSSCVSYHPLF